MESKYRVATFEKFLIGANFCQAHHAERAELPEFVSDVILV